jgi:hypothetical protein
MPVDRRFAGSNSAESDKNRRTPSFGWQVKPCVQCRKMLRNVEIPAEYDRDITSAKFKDISRKLPASLLRVSAATREL